ncbi:MAG TPA: N-acetylmuramoyl-L-alanine amidase [Candidatus Krumholzibacteria bacterium]|nr:N-acetylmuramoyl-L-alanine amidase [Candidatus Krumholzibacteria bacterium]HPD71088.1 N-acetylmuramoyl-L-alanine amidase [Candidatus Krumholzibacteria bacterium]HRY39212.1 N-acetylmuramoyl-L-alanine amidase [Candidatus Krumholzibacteria bacterium]
MDGTRPGFASGPWRRFGSGTVLVALIASLVPAAAAEAGLRIGNRYSPVNQDRPVRERTEFIVLHTTEGGDRPSLERIRRGGLAHYVVMRDGQVYRVISRQRVARHAGCSMWDGVEDIDRASIGIEVVGYHNQPITDAQIAALRDLLGQLQDVYEIGDDHVLTHSMVAYGKRNRWHRYDHRGRKRCGMLFARPELRAELGLDARPTTDPDVDAGRLRVADPYLATVLFAPTDQAEQVAQQRFEGPDADVITAERTAWFIARDEYDSERTVYVFPGGRRLRGNEITDWLRMPVGTRVLTGQDPPAAPSWRVLGRDGGTPADLAGDAYDAPTTLYIQPNGRVDRGDRLTEPEFGALPAGTRVFVGFRFAGKVTSQRSAFEMCGPSYLNETTLYLLPGGAVRSGAEISERSIPGGTLVLVGG